jgi:hypothetical protein
MKTFGLIAVSLVACVPARTEPDAPPPAFPERTPESGPSVPPPSIWMWPVDMSTAVGRSVHPRLDIRHGGRPVGAALSELASRLTMKTWPELAPVASSVIARDAVRAVGVDSAARIDVNPAVALGDRWYALVIDTVPTEFDWPLYQPSVSLPTGAVVSRFKTVSAPLVISVRICDKPATAETQVVLDVSEPILAGATEIGQAMTISQAAADPRCRAEATSDPTMSGTLMQSCAALDAQAPFSVSLAPALASGTGKLVAPFSATLFPYDMVDTGTCRLLRIFGSASAVLP